MLNEIFERQLELQTKSFGVDPVRLDQQSKLDYIRDMTLACEDELHEALNECAWKPWQTADHIDSEAMGAELVDALHFLVNLFLAIGWSADDVIQAYHAKAARNAERQAAGYTGTEKCRECNRALDDPHVLCTKVACHA